MQNHFIGYSNIQSKFLTLSVWEDIFSPFTKWRHANQQARFVHCTSNKKV